MPTTPVTRTVASVTETDEFWALVTLGTTLPDVESPQDDAFDMLVNAMAAHLGVDRVEFVEAVNDAVCETFLYPNGRSEFIRSQLD